MKTEARKQTAGKPGTRATRQATQEEIPTNWAFDRFWTPKAMALINRLDLRIAVSRDLGEDQTEYLCTGRRGFYLANPEGLFRLTSREAARAIASFAFEDGLTAANSTVQGLQQFLVRVADLIPMEPLPEPRTLAGPVLNGGRA